MLVTFILVRHYSDSSSTLTFNIPDFHVILPLIRLNADCVTQLEGKKSATAKAGSCVTIRCTVSATGRSPYDTEYWIKDWVWTNNTHIGIIVRSNTAVHPVAQEYDGRTALVDSHSCSLQICNLQKTDEGYYSFRVSRSKYNPCQVETKPSVIVLENEDVNLECSTSAACESAPEWLTSGLDPRFKSPPNSSKSNKTSVLEFRADQQDDGRVLSCQPRGNQDGFLVRTVPHLWSEVNHAYPVSSADRPHNLNLIMNSSITEFQMLVIICTVKSNPTARLTLLRDGAIPQKLYSTYNNSLQFELKVSFTHAGCYTCVAENSEGKNNVTKVLNVNCKQKVNKTKQFFHSQSLCPRTLGSILGTGERVKP
uniref:Ig-like domain-containing protein n=1 Tax=Denticeps clupeoides TaxID=299321 RepID=A0AAY4ESN9_9TELE